MLSQADMLWGLQMCNYSAMAALAFTFWDILITTNDEIEQIWQKPWTKLTFLYVFLRSFSPLSQIVSTVITLRLPTGDADIPDNMDAMCLLLAGFQGASSQVLMLGVQWIMILRVKALYNRNAFIRRTLPILYAAEIVLMSIVIGISMPEIRYGPYCVIIFFPWKATVFLITPILFESLLFTLTMRKFYYALRDGWGRTPFISRFMKDGIWAFALPFIIMLINTCCMAFLDSALSSVAYSWVIAIPGFAGYRLILNMSHLLKLSPGHSSGEYSDEVMVDTILYFTDYENHVTTDYDTTLSRRPPAITVSDEPDFLR